MTEHALTLAKIVVTDGKSAGTEFPLIKRAVFEIGRAASSHIEIPDPGVAMNQCRIYKEQDIYTLYDLNTTKGTFINGQRITKEVLNDGDTIKIGPVEMVFRGPDPGDAPGAAVSEEAQDDLGPAPWEEAVRRKKDELRPGPEETVEEESPVVGEEPIGEEAPAAASAGRITVLEGPIAGTVFDLRDKEEYHIGRATDADVKIMDIKISRHHSQILCQEGHWFVQDRDSRNGTFLNGELVRKEPLKDGDHIKVGFSIMQFNTIGGPPPAPPQKSPEKPKRRKKKAASGRKVAAAPEVEEQTRTRVHADPPEVAGTITCELCSRELSADDLKSGLAVAHQGKNYCLTCVRKLQNLASGATGGAGPAPKTTPKDSLDDHDIDLLLKEEVEDEDDLFP